MRHSTRKKAMHPRPSHDAPTASVARARGPKHAWLVVIIGAAGLVGGYQLQRIVSALPVSNRDFIFFWRSAEERWGFERVARANTQHATICWFTHSRP